jgi:hypothetical protein
MYLEDAADNDTIREHVEVIFVPFAGRATRRSALQDQSHYGFIGNSYHQPPARGSDLAIGIDAGEIDCPVVRIRPRDHGGL